MKFRNTTPETLVRDLKKFAKLVEAWQDEDFPVDACDEVCLDFNRWMDRLLGQDAFGTEGQQDPRGDHRD